MKKVFFLTRHEADKGMIEDVEAKLGEKIELAHLPGSYSDFRVKDSDMVFDRSVKQETGEVQETVEVIPSDSLVIAVLPPALQQGFSGICNKLGITYLFPMFDRVPDEKGDLKISQYAGLAQCLRVEIVTELWAGRESIKRR